MPTEYFYRTGTTRVSCSRCGARREVNGRPAVIGPQSRDQDFHPITDFIRWLPARDVFHSWCRECERQARRNAPRRSPRVPESSSPSRYEARRFGVEMELTFPRGTRREEIGSALMREGLTNWRVKSDASLSGNGWEIVSPPLSGDDGMEQLRKACRALNAIGASVNASCGLHVHHEIGDLTVDGVKRLARGWAENQGILDGLVSRSRRSINRHTYCGSLQPDEVLLIERARTLQDIRHLRISRYRSLNMAAYGRHGTVEVRQHQGTSNFAKIRSWVHLGQALVDAARVETTPRASTVRGLLDGLGRLLDETAKTFLLGRAVEFDAAPVT